MQIDMIHPAVTEFESSTLSKFSWGLEHAQKSFWQMIFSVNINQGWVKKFVIIHNEALLLKHRKV